MKKFNVSKDCNGCGLCVALTDLLVEDEKGFAHPNTSKYITDDLLEQAEDVVTQCPVGAISIIESETKNLSKLADELEKRLKKIDKASFDWDSIAFKSDKYKIGTSVFKMFFNYNYADRDGWFSSESKAASSLINHYYNQVDAVIMEVLSRYKNDVLMPYWSKDGSFYAEFNKQFSEVLKEISTEASALTENKISLPKDFISFDVYPDDDETSYLYNYLKTFDIRYLEKVKGNKFLRPASELYSYVDVEKTDWYLGEGLFGRMKFEKRYQISEDSIDDVSEEIVGDINDAIFYSDIDDEAKEWLQSIISEYNRNIEKTIEEKIEQFKKACSL